jgi:hypothetical protein
MKAKSGRISDRGIAWLYFISGMVWLIIAGMLVFDNITVQRGYESDPFFLILVVSMILVGIGFAAFGSCGLSAIRGKEK